MFAFDHDEIKGMELEEGVCITCATVALGGRVLLVGTDRGTVVSLVADGPADKLTDFTPVHQLALHHGPVYRLAISTSLLICSTGHDARCCVFPLSAMLTPPECAAPGSDSDGADAMRWIAAHSLPVVDACFFSDGFTIASLDISGVLVLSRINEHGASVQDRVACGFPARVLALSQDQTCCFVGGAGLARVDWQEPFRPLDTFNTATTAPANGPRRHGDHSSSTPASVTPMVRLDESGAEAALPPPGTLVSRIHVAACDGSVRAYFSKQEKSAGKAGTAISTAVWSVDGPKWFVARTFAETPSNARSPKPSSGRRLQLRLTHHTRASRSGITACRQRWPSVLSSRLVLNPSVLALSPAEQTVSEQGDWWSSSLLLSQPYPALSRSVARVTASIQTAKAGFVSDVEELAREEERNKELQGKCSEIAQQLKVLVEAIRKNKDSKRRV